MSNSFRGVELQRLSSMLLWRSSLSTVGPPCEPLVLYFLIQSSSYHGIVMKNYQICHNSRWNLVLGLQDTAVVLSPVNLSDARRDFSISIAKAKVLILFSFIEGERNQYFLHKASLP